MLRREMTEIHMKTQTMDRKKVEANGHKLHAVNHHIFVPNRSATRLHVKHIYLGKHSRLRFFIQCNVV